MNNLDSPLSCNKDDRHTFEDLCRVYRAMLVESIDNRMDDRLRQRQDASDIVQEALLETFMRLEDFYQRQPMPMPAWLMESAIQQLRMAIRRHMLVAKRSLRKQVSFDDTGIQEIAEDCDRDQESPEEDMIRDEESSEMQWAIEQLPEPDRQIITLRNIHGLSNTEAASVLEISPEAASKRHSRSLVRLVKILRANRPASSE